KDAAEKEFTETRERITTEFDADHQAIQREIAETRRRVGREFIAGKHQAKSEFQEARWTIQAMHEADRNRADGFWKEAKERVAEEKRRMQVIQAEANRLVGPWRGEEDDDDLEPAGARQRPARLPGNVPDSIAVAEALLAEMTREILPCFFKKRRLLGLCTLACPAVLAPLALAMAWDFVAAAAILCAVTVALAGRTLLYSSTRTQLFHAYQPLGRTLDHAAKLCTRYLLHVKKKYRRERARAKKKSNRDL